jgi:hypothetical protein
MKSLPRRDAGVERSRHPWDRPDATSAQSQTEF